MNEVGNAHDAGDCPVSCPHPDHDYDDAEFGDLDLEYLFELRQTARGGIWPSTDYDWGDE